jgi:hypothetical protein
MYINEHVGEVSEGNYGTMYFGETLNDWSKFDINKRTKHDASISSGLAVMACNKHLYTPTPKVVKQALGFTMSTYNNSGNLSKLIKK